MARIARASVLRDVVRIVWSDAHVSRFHHAWLRDHCPQSLHPSSGQRTVTIAAAARATPAAAAVGEGADGRQTLSIDWLCEPGALGISAADSAAGGGGGTDARQRSVFESGWLRAQCYADEAAQRTAAATADGAVAPWGPDITAGSNRPIVQWAAMRPVPGASEGANAGVRSALEALHARGFCLVRGVPSTMEATRALAEQIGVIQTTFYGTMWDTGADVITASMMRVITMRS